MATGGEKKAGYSLANVGTVTLEDTDGYPFYVSVAVCQGKIVVIDKAWKVRLHQLLDGKCISMSEKLESIPRDMCLMDTNEICVILGDGLIKMMSIDSASISCVFTTTRTLRLQRVLDRYHGVVRFKENLFVSGIKQGTMYWCVVSLDDGHVETLHQICKGNVWSRVVTKNNIIYISCYAGTKSPHNGVYGFDILNPNQRKYIYKHQRLPSPTSLVINQDGDIYVGNFGVLDSCVHQITDSCQLVAIFTQGIPSHLHPIFSDHVRLYGTSYWSSDITVFQPVYQDSEVETSIGIENGKVDKVLSNIKTEMLPSGPAPEYNDDGKQVEHTATDVLIGDGTEQPITGETATHIPIQKRVEETLNRAGIKMATEDRDLFLRFQQEIGTTLYFSADQQSLIDAQKSLDTTEAFIQKNKPNVIDKWNEYRDQGKLTPEVIDVLFAEERNQELHESKDYFLNKMEQLNIITRARSFNENGVMEANYFYTPCMLHKESPSDIVAPEKDARILSTSTLCWVITGMFRQPAIFQNLIAACLAHWPVAKQKETSENLIFQDCTVFDCDPLHRLVLHCENHFVCARITRMGIDDIDAKICTRVRKFITLNVSEIISRLDLNVKYKMCVQIDASYDIPEDIRSRLSPPCEIWFVDEVHDPNAPITREHMNHARLCVALSTVCGNVMRDILLAKVPAPYTNIYQAILASKTRLTSRTHLRPGQWQNALLSKDQCQMVFTDPKGRYTAPVDHLDISLLYTLIRNVSTVDPPSKGWGVEPPDKPRDDSLGANVERIHLYRNRICGHSPDGQISQEGFEDCWKKLEAVLHDIEAVIGGQVYSQELEKQKRQVISVYEAC